MCEFFGCDYCVLLTINWLNITCTCHNMRMKHLENVYHECGDEDV